MKKLLSTILISVMLVSCTLTGFAAETNTAIPGRFEETVAVLKAGNFLDMIDLEDVSIKQIDTNKTVATYTLTDGTKGSLVEVVEDDRITHVYTEGDLTNTVAVTADEKIYLNGNEVTFTTSYSNGDTSAVEPMAQGRWKYSAEYIDNVSGPWGSSFYYANLRYVNIELEEQWRNILQNAVIEIFVSACKLGKVAAWVFDNAVIPTFEDLVEQAVPQYFVAMREAYPYGTVAYVGQNMTRASLSTVNPKYYRYHNYLLPSSTATANSSTPLFYTYARLTMN